VSSKFAATEVQRLLNVDAEKIAVCPAGVPEWTTAPARADAGGYILFIGTLDARKNIGGLLEAYGRVLVRSAPDGSPSPAVPRLVLAGAAGADAAPWLAAIAARPLAGHVEYLGYVPAERREALLKGAQMLVLPSFEEGFGLPALEAMSAGVPVVASSLGALPDVIGNAGLLIDPNDPDSLADAITRMARDSALRSTCAARGLERSRQFSWAQTARDIRRAYEDALIVRRHRTAALSHAHRH
jgi:glycosyltransferase involved in cell wall biosynthesis